MDTHSIGPKSIQDKLSRNLRDLLSKIALMGNLIKEQEAVRHHMILIKRLHGRV